MLTTPSRLCCGVQGADATQHEALLALQAEVRAQALCGGAAPADATAAIAALQRELKGLEGFQSTSGLQVLATVPFVLCPCTAMHGK
jgi:hypothetical protein